MAKEVIIKMKKKCPICNSTRTVENKDYFSCMRCGYVNKKIKVKNEI